jgi:hypothetical protein
MLQETPDEFFCGQSTTIFFFGLGVAVSKGYQVIFQFEQAVVADSNPEDIRGQIFKGIQTRAYRFTVYNPFLRPNCGGDLRIESFISQSLMKFTSKEARKGLHRQQEILSRWQPCGSI